MARLSMNEITTFRWSFEEDVYHYRAAGFDSIAVWRQKVTDFGDLKARELLDDKGMDVSALLWAGGFTGSDGRSYRDSVKDGLEAVDLAADLRAGCLVLYSGARAGHTHNHARRLFCNAIKELAPRAAELGVVLAIEPMHAGCAADWTFLTSWDATLEILQTVGDSHLKLVLDAYHMGHDAQTLDRLSELAPHLALVQLGDCRQPPNGEQNRCRLGDGCLPLGEIVEQLKAAGYAGYYDIELMGEELEGCDYAELLQHSKQSGDNLLGAPG
jgi:sugar phosphate isomerase/epimerase